jgi:hypothetical protein
MNRGILALSFSWGRGRIKEAAVVLIVPVARWTLMCDHERLT